MLLGEGSRRALNDIRLLSVNKHCPLAALFGLAGVAFALLTLGPSRSAGQSATDFEDMVHRCTPVWIPNTTSSRDGIKAGGRKDLAFARQAIGLLNDPLVRRRIGFAPQQEETFCRLRRERFRRVQLAILDSTDKWWATLTPEQQAKLHEPGMHAGPLSGLAYASEVGFDTSESVPGYPFLAEAGVRDRLGLTAEQEKQLQAIARAYQEERNPSRDYKKPTKPVTPGEFHRLQEPRPTKEKVEALLTPRQLTMLKEISFRKNRSWAIDVPRISRAVGVTEKQKAECQRLRDEENDHLCRIDSEAVAEVMKLLTPAQCKKLRLEIEQRRQ
jgi:hypothetical protein